MRRGGRKSIGDLGSRDDVVQTTCQESEGRQASIQRQCSLEDQVRAG